MRNIACNGVWLQAAIATALIAVFVVLNCITLPMGDMQLHTIAEVVAALVALMVGVVALVRHYARPSNMFLVLGLGFVGTALFDVYHGIVTSSYFQAYVPLAASLAPWSWNASRTFLAVVMCLSLLAWRRERRLGASGRVSDVVMLAGIGSMTLISFLFFAFIPLGPANFPNQIFGRPEELVPAAIFAVALLGYGLKEPRNAASLDTWITSSLVVGFLCQALFMSRSHLPFDVMHGMAHLLKVGSYGLVLAGLLSDIFALWRREQRLSEDLHESNRELAARVREVERAQDQLEVALTSANVGLWDWNPRTDEVFFSPTLKTQLGYPGDATWDHFDDWDSRLHPEDREAAKQRVYDYFAQRQGYKSTFRMRCQDGTYRWLLSQGRAQFDVSNVPTRMTGVLVDITERKHQEEELVKLNSELERRAKDLEQFAYAASHDLKTPLRGIAGFAQFLKEDYQGKLDERADDYMERIVEAVKRMQGLIDDLLDYCKVGSKDAVFEPTNMNEVLDDVLSILHADIRDSGVEVTRDELPVIAVDRSQLTQLMQNLVANGIKYRSGKQPKVHVSASQSDTGWVVSVQDNGIGIAPKCHESVFEIFRQLHAHSVYPGSGIGLAVCRRIAERHGGRIWVESEEGKGSTFRFTVREQERSAALDDRAEIAAPELCEV